MFTPPLDPSAPVAESVLVYGNDPTAIVTMAVGLATRRQRSFSWADCAVTADGLSQESRSLLERGWSRSFGEGVDTTDLIVPRWTADTLERVLVPESRMDSLRLMGYLTLPSLLQALAAMSTSPSGESFVLLTNIDALDRKLRASVFGRPDVHRRLHEAKVSLFATAKSRPTRVEQTAFERILRIAVARDALWPEGTVRLEKGYTHVWGDGSMLLRDAWQRLRLDSTLLPLP